MKLTAKDIALIGIYVALLIASQLALSAVAGLEFVTVLLLSFCYSFGALRGSLVATLFSLLRCLIFGFFINVVVLYLIYYNLFALFFGWLGKRLKQGTTLTKTALVVALAAVFTVCFTLLDDLLTPLIFQFSKTATEAYFYASLYTLIPQTVFSSLSVAIFFIPMTKLFTKLNKNSA